MDAEKFNYYDILEVNPHSPQHEITTAYEKAKLTYSIDNPAVYTIFSEDEARELLKLVEEAYAVIGNKTLRALYDEKVSQIKSTALTQESISYEALKTISQTPIFSVPQKLNLKSEYQIDPTIEEEIKIQSDWTGSFLKKVREYKRFSVEDLSQITKISSFYIRAIEGCEPGNLPAPVFVRGYVSQLCRVLNLPEKKVCDSYMKFFKEAATKDSTNKK